MTASSVTGVGQGSADKAGQKGSEHLFVGVNKLIGPRVVLAGINTAASNVFTVSFPAALSGVTADYAILVTVIDSTASTKSAHVTSINSTGGQITGFAVWTDGASDAFHWIVVRVNSATVQVN